MKVRVVDAVGRELKRIVALMEVARVGTGYRLYGEFLDAGDTLAQNPWFFPRVDDQPFGGEFREAPLLDSTYRMIFEVRTPEVVVVSLIHAHRRPGAWHRTLGEAD